MKGFKALLLLVLAVSSSAEGLEPLPFPLSSGVGFPACRPDAEGASCSVETDTVLTGLSAGQRASLDAALTTFLNELVSELQSAANRNGDSGLVRSTLLLRQKISTARRSPVGLWGSFSLPGSRTVLTFVDFPESEPRARVLAEVPISVYGEHFIDAQLRERLVRSPCGEPEFAVWFDGDGGYLGPNWSTNCSR